MKKTTKGGYLPVGNGHEIYYEYYKNAELKPLVFLHGGPGSGFNDGHKKLFNPDEFHVLFYDQRGAGKSKPYLSLEKNTTEHLVDDIAKLLDECGIDTAVLTGASWGATLALLFAIKYPERVEAMVLAGIFIATREEAQAFVDGSTAEEYRDVWERFIRLVPEDKRGNVAGYYLDRMLNASETERDEYFFNWALYDISLSTGETSREKLEPVIRKMSYKSLSLITAYYIENDFFLPDNYVLENIDKINDIPTVLIQSSEDVVTRPEIAQKLHKKLRNSELIELSGAHAGGELKEKLVKKVETMVRK